MINELHAEYSVDEDNNEKEDEDLDVMMVVSAEEWEQLVIVFAHCLKAVESCVDEDGWVWCQAFQKNVNRRVSVFSVIQSWTHPMSIGLSRLL